MPPPLNWTPETSQPQPGSDAALALGWTWPSARQACDDFARGGSFSLAWQLWLDCDTLPAIKAAKEQRIAMSAELPWEVCGDSRAQRAPGRFELEGFRVVWEQHGARLLDSTHSDVIGLGMSVWQHPTSVNPATLRREIITCERWPLSQVRFTETPFADPWNPGKWIHGYYAVQFGVGPSLGAVMFDAETGRVDVRFVQLPRPGETDGHWTVFGRGDRPHLRGAIRALDVSFVAGALSRRARANLLKTLGRQSPVGELPGSTAVDSPEGKALERVVAGLGTTTTGAVLPGGAKISAFSLTTQTAGLFIDDANLNVQDVELAILGRSETLAKMDAQYVAKGGPSERVPEKLVRADTKIIRNGFDALAARLSRENAGDCGKIYLEPHLPDTEQDARRAARQQRRKAYLEELAAEKVLGATITQEHADALAEQYDVEPVIVASPPPAPPQDAPEASTQAPAQGADLEPKAAPASPEPEAASEGAARLLGYPADIPHPELTAPEFAALVARQQPQDAPAPPAAPTEAPAAPPAS